MDITKTTFSDFLPTFIVVCVIAFAMISIALGIRDIFGPGYDTVYTMPMPSYVIFLLFAVLFVITSVVIETSRDVEFPWSLLGGAILSFIITFIFTLFVGGVQFLLNGGVPFMNETSNVKQPIRMDEFVFALSVCIIASMVLVNYVKFKKS